MKNKKKPVIQNIYPLTPMQEGMLYNSLLNKDSHAYFEQISFDIHHKMDTLLLEKSLNTIIERHEILRAIFNHKKAKQPIQIILKERSSKVYFEDISNMAEDKKEGYIQEYKAKVKNKGFDLSKDIMIKLAVFKTCEETYKLIFNFHHILMDGWCIGIIIKEFFQTYKNLEESKEVKLERVYPYGSYISWLQKQDKKKARKYWKNFLANYEKQTSVPKKGQVIDKEKYELKEFTFKLDEDFTQSLEEIAKNNNVTFNSVFHGLWSLLLKRYNSIDDVVYGTVVSGRPHEVTGVEKIVGLFINTIPVRAKFSEGKTFKELIKELQNSSLESEKYNYFPLAQIQADTELKQGLLDHIVVFENYPLEDEIEGSGEGLYGYEIDNVDTFEQTDYNFNVIILPGKELLIKLTYNALVYNSKVIENIEGHLKEVANAVIENCEISISDICLLSPIEEKNLLVDFNDTKLEYPKDKTIHQLFEEQAQMTPDNIAVVYKDKKLTYEELNGKANSLAKVLKQENIKTDDVVGILANQSIEMFVGIMAVLKAGGAYLPIDPKYPESRINYMLSDSNAKVLLTQSNFIGDSNEATDMGLSIELEDFNGKVINLEDDKLYSEDESNLDIGQTTCNSNNLAYIIYTSGSTGKPKGVMIEHKSLVNLCYWHNHEFEVTEKDNATKYAGVGFDASVWEIFPYLIKGSALHIIDDEIRLDVNRLNKYFEENNITISFLPTQMCEQFMEVENTSLRKLLTGGDKLKQYKERNYDLVNNYGPTECTVVTTSFTIDKEYNNLPIGKPVSNAKVYILDKNNKPAPIGVAGELCVGGDGLARGYLNRPDLTEKAFVENPFAEGEKMYRTGDLVRWLPNGNIEFLGRIDNQVQIRGFRVELGEIENRLLSYEDIKEAVVIDNEDESGSKYLCGYYVLNNENTDTDTVEIELKEYLGKELPDYMIPSYFIELEEIPLTPNGKIDRKALPRPEGKINTGAEYEAPRNETEEKLVEIWGEILGVENVGINDNFFDLGGHSLKATSLMSKIHKELNVELPLQEMFKNPTIKGISKYIRNSDENIYSSIEPVEEKENYILSSAQRRMYILNQYDRDVTTYNMPSILEINGKLDVEKLEKIFGKIIDRHESLRTIFKSTEKGIVQIICKEVDFKVEYIDKSNTNKNDNELTIEIGEIIDTFIRPFDFNKAPLLRVGIIKIEEEKYVLMLDIHHIISDGVSAGVLTSEFAKLYNGEELPELRIQYKDYAVWQQEKLQSEELKEQEKYWLEKFQGEIPVLNMPIDYPRPPMQSFEGGNLSFKLDKNLKDKLQEISKSNGSTMYMTLLAAYNILLHKYTGQEDIVVGSPIAGRPHNDLENIIGMFVNTLAMRNHPSSDKTFSKFLKEIKENSLKAFANQDYQFEDIVEKLDVKRDTSRNPLFDTMLILQNMDIESEITELEELKISPYDVEGKVSRFDITLIAEEGKDGIDFNLEYCTKLFKRETIERFSNHFVNIIKQIVSNPELKISEVKIMSQEEKQQMLMDFNDTETEYQIDKTINQLFEEQVEKTPDDIAIAFRDEKLTYRELNERANQIARLLRDKGVKSDSMVGLMVERSVEMLVGIMGVLKVGGAYLPIDPEYPVERTSFMLEDSKAEILLTQSSISNDYFQGEYQNSISMINLDDENIYSGDGNNLEIINSANSLAYVIYTSGSTGKPKGVLIEHRNVNNFIKGITERIDFSNVESILCLTTISFDIFVLESLLPMVKGIKVVLAGEKEQMNPKALNEIIIDNNVDAMQTTPSRMKMLIEGSDRECFKTLKLALVGGEAFPESLSEEIGKYCDGRIYNMYGPTETTVWSTVKEVTGDKELNIGKPIANTQVYILDKDRNLQPVGVAGELCIAGDGLAREYFNRPELTAEKFVENPFAYSTEGNEIKMYRTGDLARWLPDGNIEFLGRIDHQVKVRGYRIELGEIESKLIEHESVKEAVVIAGQEQGRVTYLCGYIVCDGEVKVQEFREHLSKDLPDYMIPSYFIQLEEIPLTPNGKIDRKTLPEPKGNIDTGVEYIAPETELEKKLAEIWGEVLENDRIGINDDIFNLGGHSISMMQISAKIANNLDVDVSIGEFMKNNTICKLAKLITTKKEEDEERVIYPQVQPNPEEIHEEFPLTDVQMAYLMGRDERFEMGGISTHIYMELEVDLDMDRFNKALNKVIERHPMLRAIVLPSGQQKILDEIPKYDIEIEDIMEMGSEDKEAVVLKERARMSNPVFKSDQWPLFEIKAFKADEDTHYMLIGLDMLIVDASSIQIILKEVNEYYENLDGDIPELEFTFRDYIKAYRDFKTSKKFKEDKEYWLSKLNDFPDAPELPLKVSPTSVKKPNFKRFKKSIEVEKWNKLKKKAYQNNITPSALLCSAYGQVLGLWSNQQELAVNLTVFNRYPFHKEVEKIVGDFTSVILVDMKLEAHEDFWQKTSKVQENLLNALEHRHYDGVDFIRDISRNKNLGNKAAMPVVFTSMLTETGSGEGEEGKVRAALTQTSQVFLDHQATEQNGDLILVWDYVEELFDKEVVSYMFNQYTNLLESLLDETEYQIQPHTSDLELIEQYNDTIENIPKSTLDGMFMEQVKRVPECKAIIFKDESITYKGLDEKSNRVARYLIEQGVGKDDYVGVIGKRCIATIVNIMGIIKANAAYVPVDPAYPEGRKNYIIENSDCKLMLKPDLYEKENLEQYSGDFFDTNCQPDDIAYVIYTSGSTGRPKGVVIKHSAASNTIIDINRKFKVDENDRIIGLSSMCFDLSVYDIFGAFASGAALVMVEDQRDVFELIDIMDKEQITIWNSVPAIMDMMVENVDENYLHTSLKLVMMSGDWIPLTLPNKVKKHFPNTEVISLGGATEASIWSIYYPIEDIKDTWKSIPYGFPLANQEFYVLNYEMNLCPIGVEGELYIGGVGVAEGYMNDEAKTKAGFINHPKLGNLYRTGDYGVMVKDTERDEVYIEFHGRKDHQVKIRGYRIELGEIENCLLNHDFISNAAVIDKTDSRGKKFLCAYYVSEDEEEIPAEELKIFLGRNIPEYMIPSYFIQIEEVPLTQNEKLDRKALPMPDISIEDTYVAPTNETEEKLCSIWEKILGLEKVGINDEFFDIGGNSLSATKLISEARKEFQTNIPLREIFGLSTVKKIAEYIMDNQEVACSFEDENLVLLSKGTDPDKHMFFVHAGSGEAEGYMGLCNELSDEFNYWGIKADRFEKYYPRNYTIEEIAEKYVAKIKKIQHGGPYHIVGWCVGGTTAFEIVKQIEESGEKVEFFTLINSYAPQKGFYDGATRFSIDTERELAKGCINDSNVSSDIDFDSITDIEKIWHILIDYAKDKGIEELVAEKIKNYIPDNIASIVPNVETIDLEGLIYYLHVIRTYATARGLYIPSGKINVQAYFLEATESKISNKDRWNEYCEKDVVFNEVKGTHFSIFQPPNLSILSEKFKKYFLK